MRLFIFKIINFNFLTVKWGRNISTLPNILQRKHQVKITFNDCHITIGFVGYRVTRVLIGGIVALKNVITRKKPVFVFSPKSYRGERIRRRFFKSVS